MPDSYFGKYTGIVKDNRDGAKLGQLKVSVPAIFPPDELMTARAALPYGFFFVPEEGARVWIEFEGGDPGLPLWTGVQYVGGGDWPGEAQVDPPQHRVVKSAAGHSIVFADGDDDASIVITDGKNGHIIKLDANGIEISDGVNGHKVRLTSSGIAIDDKVNGGSVELAASGATVDSGQGVKLQLQPGLATLDSGGGSAEVKGATVMLGTDAAMPVMRMTDQAIGNLGAPVVLISTSTVRAS